MKGSRASEVGLFSPENLWRLAISIESRGLSRLAKGIKQFNSLLFHNSLATGARIGDDLYLGHHGLGAVVHDNVVLGDNVTIWQNVTLAVRSPKGSSALIRVGNGVEIGCNSVIITRRGASLTIGESAGIGAGSVVVDDVPAGATVVGDRAREVANDES